jgi:hypothetical protein
MTVTPAWLATFAVRAVASIVVVVILFAGLDGDGRRIVAWVCVGLLIAGIPLDALAGRRGR